MSETVEKENAVPVADDVEDKAAFLEKRPEGSANRCSFMCLTSTANIGRALTAAVAKASVYQCAGKPFADPKACVGPLAADLVEYLAGDVGGGDPGEGAAGALSDLHSAMEAWTTSKKSWLGSVGETFSKASQTDAIDALKSAVFKGEGWKVSDRERVSRELLLRVRHASCPNGSGVSRTAGFSVLLTRSVPSHFLLQYDRGKLAHCEEAFETADALYEHKLACAFRPVQCPNEGCAEVFGANAAGGHDALCAFKVLECPRGCGEGVTRRELEAHVTSTCAKRPVECPFASLGCDVETFAGTLEAHCVECAPSHLELVAERVSRLDTSARDGDAKLASMAGSLAMLEPRLREMSTLREEVEETAAKTEASERAHAETEKLLAGAVRNIASVEAELKTTRRDLALVMSTVDRMVKAQERAARETVAREKAAAAANRGRG